MNFRLGKYYGMKILSLKNLARVGLAVAVTLNFARDFGKQNIVQLKKNKRAACMNVRIRA